MTTPEPDPRQWHLEQVIRDFSWGNYGLHDPELGLADYPDDQEWVADLAKEILNYLDNAL